MENHDVYVDIILPLPLEGSFTFKLPWMLHSEVEIGKRAIVQFGRKKIYTCVIVKIHNQKPKDYQVKEIIEIIDSEPIVNQFQLKLWSWMANYYMCSIGQVYRAALPSGLKIESETNVILKPNIPDDLTISSKEEIVIDNLKTTDQLNIGNINQLLGIKNSIPIVKSLIEKQVVTVEETLVESFKIKTESYLNIAPKFRQQELLNDVLENLKRAPKQYELLLSFISLSHIFSDDETQKITRKQFLKITASSHAILNGLIKKGILEISEQEISRLQYDSSEIN